MRKVAKKHRDRCRFFMRKVAKKHRDRCGFFHEKGCKFYSVCLFLSFFYCMNVCYRAYLSMTKKNI
jgi:hypothetical protein